MQIVVRSKKWGYLIVALVVMALALGACASPDPQSSKEQSASPSSSTTPASANDSEQAKRVTIIHSLPVDTMDPHIGWIALRAGVTETLVRLDENMQVQPWLAAEWEQPGPTTWVFTLRDNIHFQDGSMLDAQAAKLSFERGIADSASLAASLKLASIEADGQRLTFTTTEPHPAFPTELVHPTASLISVAAEEELGKDRFNLAPVGTGPFKVTSFVPGKEINLSRFDEYWDGAALLSEVVIQFNSDANVRTLAFQSKQADIVYHLAPEALEVIDKDAELSVESVTSMRTHYFTYNPMSAQVNDARVRQALDKLIDRDAIVKEVMLGHALPAAGPFNPLLPFGSERDAQSLDVEGAVALLAEAGYVKGNDGKLAKDGQPLSLKLIAFSGINPELPLIPLVVQSEAAKAGIAIDIISVEYPETYIKESTDWDLSTATYLTAPRGDGGSFLNAAYMPGGAYNSANIEVEGLAEVVEELNATDETSERYALTRRAVDTINEALPHSYIIHPNILVGVHKSIQNWKPGAEEFYIVTNKLDVN
ncbi:nickel ABC transporter substrate-binding protein [Cohnella sp.]|uniref:nickel ABC transporter substrate-binding protein n=1 Tax=Cohnella sp. TaxID=1883426 RepID=UPI0035695E6C